MVLLGAIMCGLLNAWLAERLQRSVWGWGIAGFLFGLLSTAVLGLLELAKNVRDIQNN